MRSFASRGKKVLPIPHCAKRFGTPIRGLLAADLGGGVIKQRIARTGQGKSGGFRTLIAFRAGERAFFVYGFAKNARENIGGNDLTALKKLARELLAYDEEAIARAVRSGAFLELRCDEKAIS